MMYRLAQSDPVFNREDTKAIKGIAILLMLFHHLAGFPERVPVGFAGFESVWEGFVAGGFLQAFAQSAKICVPFYFFLGGYGLYIRWRSSDFSVTEMILNLYKAYWRVFLVFVPIAILFFARSGDDISLLCTQYVFHRKVDMIQLVLSDFIGWSCNLNSEWWFLKSYICVIPLGYLFCNAIRRNQNVWVDFFLVLGVDILISSVFPMLTEAFPALEWNIYYSSFLNMVAFSSAFFAGIVFAKYNVICAIKRRAQEMLQNVFVTILALTVLFWCRAYIIPTRAEIIYCALMIPVLSVLLDQCAAVKKCVVFFGEHSTNMWLIHSFYCYYFLEVTYVVYCSRNVWVDFLILTMLTLGSSIALNGFYKTIGRWSKQTRI